MKFNVLFREKPANIFLSLLKARIDGREMIISDLSWDLEITAGHTIELIMVYEKYDLVTKEKIGRKKVIRLTKKGLVVAENIEIIKRKLNVPKGQERLNVKGNP